MSGFHKLCYKLFPFYSLRLEQINNNALLGNWIASNQNAPKFKTRFELYEFVAKPFWDLPIDYLEFGVFEGASLKKWSELNGNPNSRFYGFDSFEGLPEDWGKALSVGAFDVKGKLPDIDDSRVKFVKGWFQDSLPGFLEKFEPQQFLIINIDADLHSSAMYCLTKLDHIIKKNTIILFDEFVSSLHEFRAFMEYCKAYRREAEALAMTDDFATQVALKVL